MRKWIIMNWVEEGNKLFENKEYDESLDCYQKAIEIDSTITDAWYNKALVHIMFGEYEESLEACERFIEAEKDDPEAWKLKGFSLFYLNNYEESVNAFNEALNLSPEDAYAWSNKGSALCNLGLWDEAIESFEKAFSLDSRYLNALKNKEKTLIYKRAEESLGETQELTKEQKERGLRTSYRPLPGISTDLSPGVEMVCPVCGYKCGLRAKGQRCPNDREKMVRAILVKQ
jgi:tetratricopeptide (TPR) repeat protein